MGNSKMGKGPVASENEDEKIEDDRGKGTNIRTGKGAGIGVGPVWMG